MYKYFHKSGLVYMFPEVQTPEKLPVKLNGEVRKYEFEPRAEKNI